MVLIKGKDVVSYCMYCKAYIHPTVHRRMDNGKPKDEWKCYGCQKILKFEELRFRGKLRKGDRPKRNISPNEYWSRTN